MSDGGADAPVLVVLVNNQSDWQHVMEDGWYRIPLKHMPHPVAATFLAFYQSRVFGADAFRVRFYAPVLRYRLVTRRELLPGQPDHPRADERYYRVELGPLVELAYPVPSRRLRRITFIPTTLRRLREADEINDLWLGDDVEDILWSVFRDAGLKAERRLEIGEGKGRYVVPLAFPDGAGGGVAVLCDERTCPPTVGKWRVLRTTAVEIRRAPHACVERVRAALKQDTRA